MIKIIGIVCALILFLISLGIVLWAIATHNPFHIVYALPFGLGSGFLFGSILGEKFGEKFGYGVFLPKVHNKIPPEKFAPIEAKIISENYEGAMQDLKEILEKNPGQPKAVAMLARLFVQKMRDYPNAYGLLSVYFENRKKPSPEDEDLAMLFVDALLEMKVNDRAIEFLKREMEKSYSQSTIKAFSQKKEALEN
jgi:hypothetical protein